MKDFYDQLRDGPDGNPVRLAEDDLKWLMSSPRGRRVMKRLLDVTGQFVPSYVPGSPEGTAFNEGRRWVGLGLLTDIRHLCPEQEFAMHQESLTSG